jgi:uncharacterized SAM-dependent methyltransferase
MLLANYLENDMANSANELDTAFNLRKGLLMHLEESWEVILRSHAIEQAFPRDSDYEQVSKFADDCNLDFEFIESGIQFKRKV